VILYVTQSHKRTKDVVTRCVFESSKNPNTFGSRAPLGLAARGELECSPNPLAAIGGGVLFLGGREGTHTHLTHTHLTALFRDYPGEPVPEK